MSATWINKVDGFLLVMLLAVALALLFPGWGQQWGPIPLSSLVNVGVALVFFGHGIMLAPSALRAGVSKWRIHVLIQSTTFVLFPVVGIALWWVLRSGLPESWFPNELQIGLLFLCAMASTISSSVALTAMARGDVAIAIFNASVSGLIGMVATPFWMHWLSMGAQQVLPLQQALLKILWVLALPLALGQCLRPWLAQPLLPYRPALSRMDRGVIVLIVFESFAQSTAAGVWHEFAWQALLVVLLSATVLLALMLWITDRLARGCHLGTSERIAVMLCGSKKSLASGAPIAKILFAGHAGLGAIMLPLMIYHQLQLLVCTALAQRWARRPE